MMFAGVDQAKGQPWIKPLDVTQEIIDSVPVVQWQGVIDLEEVPPVLHTVLGKALNTQPDKRHLNVKSFKDDIEQCNSSDALPIGQLNIGECPSCNTRNESTRKYCREYAASLVVDCLECGESIDVPFSKSILSTNH